MSFKDLLNRELKRRKWSADRAARALNECGAKISSSAVVGWRKGKAVPNLRHGKAICEAFGMDAETLVKAAARPARKAAV